LIGRGNHGRDADLSEGSTILSHIRSGIAFKRVELSVVDEGAKAMAEVAIMADTATAKDFMVKYCLGGLFVYNTST
jgi:hypothetical protein